MKRNIVFEASEFLESDNLVWDEDFEGIRKQLSRVMLFHAEKPHPSMIGLARLILGEIDA
jgi:hypothetical protein